MKVKATISQYNEAYKIYEKEGITAVYDFANANGISSWSHCDSCDAETPDCITNSCLVCGSIKKNLSN